MYHVKFFKVPIITKKGGYEIKAVLTLSNDLGDQFFFGNADIVVTIEGTKLRQVLKWTAGLQAVTVQFEAPRLPAQIVMHVEVDQSSVVDCLNDPDDHRAEYFLPIWSIPVPVPKAPGQSIQSEKYDVRKIASMDMVEETARSIAKKVWDGGIITSLYIQQNPSFLNKPKNIIELGTGCGLLGLVLAKTFNTRVLVTDLEDAQEICEKNLAKDPRVKFQVLDWEEARSLEKEWDLVIATDCTYNSTYFEPLLGALDKLAGSKTEIVIGHKYRNAEEEDFFELFKTRFTVLSDQRVDMFGESIRIVRARAAQS